MNYCYIGNTSLKVGNLLYNIEAQLILFNDLFKNADIDDQWTKDGDLQLQYLELLIQHDLIKTSDEKTGSKNARTKSAPLEDFKLVKRKEKKVTDLGNELLDLLNQKKYKEFNNFLQLDLVSLFFFKATLNSLKQDGVKDVFLSYLEVFKAFDGNIPVEIFKLIPLICNFIDREYFIKKLMDDKFNTLELLAEVLVLDEELENKRLDFFDDIERDNFSDPQYFKSSKGISAAHIVIKMYKVFMSIRIKNYSKKVFRNLFISKIDGETNYYRSLYLPHIYNHNNLSVNKKTVCSLYKTLLSFIRKGTDEDFNSRFFNLIYSSRSLNNLGDYYQQNKYYLNLTGAFEFKPDIVSITDTVNIILQHAEYKDIINKIANDKVSKDSLDYLFADEEVKDRLSDLGISNTQDLKNYKYNQSKDKLLKLLNENFTKDTISNNILPLFKDRIDNKIKLLVTENATVPTIFEYVIAIAWYYIDNKNIDFILEAGLSLDSNMLPKSHAIGGSSDFEIEYPEHKLMIEVTLTESTNQRRAEMESVSRHLGNILLSIDDENVRNKSYGIFISTYLDKNVLNDFRVRQLAYWENKDKYIKGMNILPLDTDDVVSILKSNILYDDLKEDFYNLIGKPEDRGSLWYKNYIKPYMEALNQ